MIDLCQWRISIGQWNNRGGKPGGPLAGCRPRAVPAALCALLSLAILVLSFFFVPRLLVQTLLILSGNVELNPGPPGLHDKPTRDELIELLSSSKFTAGTWEQFACRLPNVTQEIIAEIKQREPDNPMSAVAQHWLDNSTDPTWKQVVIALSDAKEDTLASQVSNDHLCPGELKNICRTVKEVLRTHFFHLKGATELCITNLADEMYSKGLISIDVRKSPTFDKMEIEFLAGIPYWKEISALENKCRLFLECLYSAGGPAKEAAMSLASEWEQELTKGHGVSLSLQMKLGKGQTSDLKDAEKIEVKINAEDDVAKGLQSLKRKFPQLLMNIRGYFASGPHEITDIARWLTEFVGHEPSKPSLTSVTSIDQLFDRIQEHYHFLNCELIEELVAVFPLDDKLGSELENYVSELEAFNKSTQLQHIKSTIKIHMEEEELKCDVVIKLTGSWRKMTIKSLNELMSHHFGEKAKCFRLIESNDGSIIVRFLVPCSQVPSLIEMAESKMQFMHHLGILQMIIKKHVIVDRGEEGAVTLEQSLLYAIKNIDSEREYEKIAFLLIKLKIDLNYQSEEGETALMLASAGGHIEIFKSLLWNNAAPTIRQASGDYIGLNSLACTALSNHMYKSTGKSETIRQSDITVEEMLERAIAEGQVDPSLISYNSFVSLITGKLQERFQKLLEQFQVLNDKFVAGITEVVTTETVPLAEIKHRLQSYAEQETQCNTVHQLIDLLQPHYSCLNVDLLSDISKRFLGHELQDQVESYIAELNTFEQTTQLLELKVAMVETRLPYIDESCSKLVIKFNKQWGSRTIAELHKFENYSFSTLSHYFNLKHTHQERSMLVCVYLIPRSQYQNMLTAAVEEQSFMSHIGICEVFIDDQPILMEDEEQQFTFEKALQQAVQANDERALFFLLDMSVTLSMKDEHDSVITTKEEQPFLEEIYDEDMTKEETMFEAIKRRDIRTVRKLLSEGCYMNYISGENGKTFLILASMANDYEITRLLLDHNPDMNIQDEDGMTALMYASYIGNPRIVELLLAEEPDLNVQNNDGMSALMLASCMGRERVVEQLLERGAYTDLRNDDGKTAWSFAAERGFDRIANMLS